MRKYGNIYANEILNYNHERVYSGQPWETVTQLTQQIPCKVFPWGVYPHSLIKPRKCQLTIIETILLARNYKIQQSNETQNQFCTLRNHEPTNW